MDRYDLIVVGAGHAGCEAAAAAARLGCRTALVTYSLDSIARMSCNPAIGGMAKGQLVREIDALGGLMAHATDATGIHFRLLGLGKGPAMWSPRAQCDRAAYSQWMKQAVETCHGLFPVQGDAVALCTDPQGVTGVGLRDGRTLEARRVVLTTGTFLEGLLHQGPVQIPGGRMGDHRATGLSDSLRGLGLTLHRLKTGTPPRLHADSIDYSLCEPQPGDPCPRPFAFVPRSAVANRVVCQAVRTTPAAHQVIRSNLHLAPLYNGQINSVGPRYCPSIEDKVVRFGDREAHLLFLEPEGVATREVYVNGLSTSLPIPLQEAMLRAIPALQKAHVLRYGYAVEYDAVSTIHLDHHFAVGCVPGLYLAGQICGTSGYEEAGIQGLLAGANAALSLLGRPPLFLSRGDAYAGVLIDDLVLRVPEEPYRMFTGRAEHRLHLRTDNADRRLVPLAATAGLVPPARAQAVAAKEAAITALVASVPAALAARIAGEALDLAATTHLVPPLAHAIPEVAEGAWIVLRYAGYLDRQTSRIERLQRQRDLPLPPDLDFQQVPGLSSESRRTLAARRPATLGQAARLAGVRESDAENLWAFLQRRHQLDAPQNPACRHQPADHGRPPD